jgi:AcrR family transcriptional regulator
MAATSADRRPGRTRQALLGAFADLMLKHGYTGLTAEQVAERANVGRSTLYAHFGGLDGILKVSLARPSAPLAALVDPTPPMDELLWLLDHLKDQRRRNKPFMHGALRAIWTRRLTELTEARLAEQAASRSPTLPWSFIAAQLAEAEIALVIHWLTVSPTTPIETIATALISTVQAMLEALAPSINRLPPS